MSKKGYSSCINADDYPEGHVVLDDLVSMCCKKPLKVGANGIAHWFICTECNNVTEPFSGLKTEKKKSKR